MTIEFGEFIDENVIQGRFAENFLSPVLGPNFDFGVIFQGSNY